MNSEISREEIDKIRSIPMAFIVGCGRSGTTLMQSMMNSHPNIVATPECLFTIILYPRYGKIRKWTKEDVVQFVDALYKLPAFALWLLNREELEKKLLSAVTFLDYALVCKMVYYLMGKDKEQVLVMVDKNPLHSLFIGKLLEIFPNSSFIHIVREPKDCVNAHTRKFNKKNTFFLAWYWKGFNASVERGKKKLPGRFFTILYEDFVKDTEQKMRELCEFLKVPYNAKIMQSQFPEMLPLYKENKAFERIKIVHEGLLSPVNDSNIGKWKKEMSERDVYITGIITGAYALSTYGYAPGKLNNTGISFSKIWMSELQYVCWKYFTRLRFASYTFNMYYRGRKARGRKNNKMLQ